MILIDNTVLSNFAIANALHLLRKFCQDQGMITQAVFEEFQVGIEKGYFKKTDISWLRKTNGNNLSEQNLNKRYRIRFGAGEASCLTLESFKGSGYFSPVDRLDSLV